MAEAKTQDAVALLKDDHRTVEDLFAKFEKASGDGRKQKLAMEICTELSIHAQIEEEIFYPAFLEASDDIDIHHEAEIEHEGAKNLIARIEGSSPEDDYFEPTVRVLSEMIKHHVKEEEKTGGMFSVAREAKMDLVSLGEELAARKAELESGETEEPDMPPPGVGETHGQVDRLMKETR